MGHTTLGGLVVFVSGLSRMAFHFSMSEVMFFVVWGRPADARMLPMALRSLSPFGAMASCLKGVDGMMNGKMGHFHRKLGEGPSGISPVATLMPGQLGP